jgi:hypothetical protein
MILMEKGPYYNSVTALIGRHFGPACSSAVSEGHRGLSAVFEAELVLVCMYLYLLDTT